MPLVLNTVDSWNKHLGFNEFKKTIGKFLDSHPTVYKAVVIAAHFFRAFAMYMMIPALPYSLPVNFALGYIGSRFYADTIEGLCPLKFTMPAFFGAATYYNYKFGRYAFINQIANQSLAFFVRDVIRIIPLLVYVIYVFEASNRDVNKMPARACCG